MYHFTFDLKKFRYNGAFWLISDFARYSNKVTLYKKAELYHQLTCTILTIYFQYITVDARLKYSDFVDSGYKISKALSVDNLQTQH